jgi:hypothetical protein
VERVLGMMSKNKNYRRDKAIEERERVLQKRKPKHKSIKKMKTNSLKRENYQIRNHQNIQM